MRSSKVTIFMQDLAGGGAERVMLLLAGGLVEHGLRVDVVLVRPEGPMMSTVPTGVRVVVLGTRRTMYSVLALARYLRRERPDALLSGLVHVNIIAVLAARLAGIHTRVVVTEHNQISRNAANVSAWSVDVAYRLVRWIYPCADAIVAVSHGVAEDLARFSGLRAHRIQVVYNPVTTPELQRLASAPVVHPWFAPGEPPVVLGVGRLTPQKDFSTLIRAFGEVRRQRTAKLVILGEGVVRKELELLIAELGLQDDVDLPGFVENPFALMAHARVLALSSVWEGLPTALIEAMACGTSVVATDCRSGPDEILLGGKYGKLVPVGDAMAMAEAIIATLNAPTVSEELCERAGDFTVERAVEGYLHVLFEGRE